MATPAYVEELPQQQTQPPQTQTQGGSVSVATASPATPQFLAEVQASPGSATQGSGPTPPQAVQTPPAAASSNATQKAAILATPTQVSTAQTQYVTAEIQSPGIQSSNGQTTPQYIVVTVTGESPPIPPTCTTLHYIHMVVVEPSLVCSPSICSLLNTLSHKRVFTSNFKQVISSAHSLDGRNVCYGMNSGIMAFTVFQCRETMDLAEAAPLC